MVFCHGRLDLASLICLLSYSLLSTHVTQATAKDSSLFKHLVTQWTLSPLAHSSSDGRPRTKVDLSLAYAFASPFHAAAASTVWERVSGMMVGGFEGRVESVYGK